jgi:hypothetical protein
MVGLPLVRESERRSLRQRQIVCVTHRPGARYSPVMRTQCNEVASERSPEATRAFAFSVI